MHDAGLYEATMRIENAPPPHTVAGRADYVAVGADIRRYPAHGGIVQAALRAGHGDIHNACGRLDQMESELDVVKADLNCDGLVDQGDLDLLLITSCGGRASIQPSAWTLPATGALTRPT